MQFTLFNQGPCNLQKNFVNNFGNIGIVQQNCQRETDTDKLSVREMHMLVSIKYKVQFNISTAH